MVIASRTPEGDPNCCPVCGKTTRIEVSTVPTRDAPCPHCGSLLWFSERFGTSLSDSSNQLRRLANEIAGLSDLALTPEAYYSEFLQRVVVAMTAAAGAVWLRTSENNLRLLYQADLRRIRLDSCQRTRQLHDKLLRHAIINGQPGLLWPHSQLPNPEADALAIGNMTDFVVLWAPIYNREEVAGLVEVWQEPKRGPEIQHSYLSFLVRMTSFASTFACRTAAETTTA